jgi:hypothetical protein
VASAAFDSARYTSACFDHGTHRMLCVGSHATAWPVRPAKPANWIRFWRFKVRVMLAFIRWYIQHRRSGDLRAHPSPVLLAERVPALGRLVTVDTHGLVRSTLGPRVVAEADRAGVARRGVIALGVCRRCAAGPCQTTT